MTPDAGRGVPTGLLAGVGGLMAALGLLDGLGDRARPSGEFAE